ncbi:DNA-binding transcriptional regulator [Escherichia coli]
MRKPSRPENCICQHAAHARTSRYITDTTKERYHQCQNVNCSATFITYESVQRYIVKPGEVHAVRPHPLPSGQQIMWM